MRPLTEGAGEHACLRPAGRKLRSDVMYALQHGLRRDDKRVPIQEGPVSAARYIDALLKSNPQETSG
jgi:hypothetical protein